jgi:hypothetical protein
MVMTTDQRAALDSALYGNNIQMALPQAIEPVWKTQRQVSRTQYDPEKLQALKTALATPRRVMTRDEIFANALANYPEAKSYTGGFGEEIINPWAEGFSNFVRGFGSAYAAAKADEREKAEQAREDAIKAAQLDYEASKEAVADQVAKDYIKLNQSKDADINKLLEEQKQREAAVAALHELNDLAENGGIWAGNKSTDNAFLSGESSKNIGRREQALSTLVPMTAKVAHDAGISGINSVGEAMLYLGIPANATSKQIKGALPGIIKKLGLEEEYYQRSPIDNGMAF